MSEFVASCISMPTHDGPPRTCHKRSQRVAEIQHCFKTFRSKSFFDSGRILSASSFRFEPTNATTLIFLLRIFAATGFENEFRENLVFGERGRKARCRKESIETRAENVTTNIVIKNDGGVT